MGETFTLKQSKFNNGEISPLSYGDVSNPKFAASLKTCQNWLPVPGGALVRRPGFAFVAPVKDQTYAPKLLPFFFSDDQTFVVELGDLYARFYQRGKYVGNDGALHTYGDSYAGGYYEIVTPFSKAMLPYLKFSQVGNVVTICYGGQAVGAVALAPRDLSHTTGALTPWAIGVTPIKIPAGAVTWPATFGSIPLDGVGQFAVGVIYGKGDRSFLPGPPKMEWVCIQETVTGGGGQAPPNPPVLNATLDGINGNLYWMPSIDKSHLAVRNSWVQTVVVQDANGVVYESAPTGPLVITSSLALDRKQPIIPRKPTLAAGYTALYYKLYRATSGLYGWVGDFTTSTVVFYSGSGGITTEFGTDNVFIDDGRTPDYTRQPPAGTDPFLVNGADSYPSVIGYLDQRRLWAGPLLLPSTFVLSKVGDLYNYDIRNTPGADTDAMQVLLAAVKLEQIRSFIPKKRGLLLTSQGEWAIAGQGGSPVSRSNIDAKQQSEWGSSWLNPISIGTGILFNTAKSNMVRDFYPLYGLYADNWDGQDLSVMARHLLDLHTLKDWAFQSTPYPVVWAVRSDGALVSITYQHAPPSFGQQLVDGVVAWARHTAGDSRDKFEEICVVPEPPDDAVYVVVKRYGVLGDVRYIERMENPVCPASPYAPGVSDVRYGRYLDSLVTYDGHNTNQAIVAQIDSVDVPFSFNPLDYAIGKAIKVTLAAPGAFVASDAVTPYGSSFVFDPENLLGLNAGSPVKGKIVGYTSAVEVVIELEVAMSQDQINSWKAAKYQWAIGKGQLAAGHILGHAVDTNDANDSRGVIALTDGDVQTVGDFLAGVAYFQTPAVVIHVGIAYDSDVALLDMQHPSVELRNRFKNIIRVGFEVAGTRDMWVGKDFTDLSQWEQREVTDAYGVMGLETGYFEEFVEGGWDKGSGGVLRHFQPLPAALVSVLREVRLGDT